MYFCKIFGNRVLERFFYRELMAQKQLIRGTIAMSAVVLIWAGFALSMRAAGTSSLSMGDVALLRFGVASVLLLPSIPGTLRVMRTTRWVPTFLIVIGGGLPFLVLVQWGGISTSAALVGTVTPGSVPVFLTVLGAVLGLRFSAMRWFGVISIAAGVVFAISAGDPSSAGGVVLLLSAGALWSLYTYSVGKTSYRPLHIAVLLSVPSAIATLVFSIAGVFPLTLFSGMASSSDILLYALVQGVVIGVVSTLLYSYSIATLGSTRSALMGAGSPVVATFLAIPFLGEIPSAPTIACLALVTVGAITANMWGKTREKARTRSRAVSQLRVRNVSF